jgi:hypothetical protein
MRSDCNRWCGNPRRVLKPISGRSVPDDHSRFLIVVLQGIVQKSAITIYDHQHAQHALSMWKGLSDAPREFFLYLSNCSTCYIPIIALKKSGIWHKRYISPCEGKLCGSHCSLQVRTEDRIEGY